jgi:hypothetical protein
MEISGGIGMTLINLKFNPEMETAIIEGRKCCTTRDEQKGKPGDIFIVRDRVYRILQVDDCDLNYASVMAKAEGFTTDVKFEDCMMEIYPDMALDSTVYIHYFAYVCDVCPQFGIWGSACSNYEKLCPFYEDCRGAKR